MEKIIAVRHAESIANTKGIYQGQSYDTNLSLLGKKQAKALAKELVSRKIEKIIASPLKRTIQTAKIVSGEIGVPVESEISIIETNHGEWEGRSKEWVKKYYPEVLDMWLTTPSKAHFPYGEKFADTDKRVREYVFGHTWTGTTLLVTHDNIIRLMLCIAKNLSIDNVWDFDLDPAGITEFEVVNKNGTKKIRVFRENTVNHLNMLRADITNHAL